MQEHTLVWDGYFKTPLNRDPDLEFMDRASKMSMRLEVSRLFEDYLDGGVVGDQDRLIRKFGTVSATYRLLGVWPFRFFEKKKFTKTVSINYRWSQMMCFRSTAVC